jgi:ribosomal protein S18 acetylase RimI-like enzyme
VEADRQLIQKHLLLSPDESAPLFNTASSLDGQAITPASASPFIPLGHISLDSDGADHAGKLSFDLEDIYRITNFYVSKALRGTGLGRQAMDALEKMAVEEPLFAKTLALNTVANDYEGWEVSYHAVKVPLPKVNSWPAWSPSS